MNGGAAVFLSIVAVIIIFLLAVFLYQGVTLQQQTQRSNSEPSAWEISTQKHRMAFSSQEISQVSVQYYADDITVHPSTSDEIIVEEWLYSQDPVLQATALQTGDSLAIRSGERPTYQRNRHPMVEVHLYLPENWQGDLLLKTTSGGIYTENDWSLAALSADTTSGSVAFRMVTVQDSLSLASTSGSVLAETLTADNLALSTTSGSIRASRLEAEEISLVTTSGNLLIDSVHGTLSVESTSGGVQLGDTVGGGEVTSVSGSVDWTVITPGEYVAIETVSGDIRLYLPEESHPTVEVSTISGYLESDFSGFSVAGNQKEAEISFDDSQVSVDLASVSGNITLHKVETTQPTA